MDVLFSAAEQADILTAEGYESTEVDCYTTVQGFITKHKSKATVYYKKDDMPNELKHSSSFHRGYLEQKYSMSAVFNRLLKTKLKQVLGW